MSEKIGRVQLFTDEPEITYKNVIDVTGLIIFWTLKQESNR